MERYRIRANHNADLTSSIPNISPYLHSQTSLGRRVDDAEISIFDAERYFKEACDDNDPLKQKKQTVILGGITESFADVSTNPRGSSVSSIESYGRNFRTRSFRATPTASSEASWNSQTGLLANAPGSVAVSLRAYASNEKRKGSNTTSRRFFGIHCPCYRKKSVSVKDGLSPRRSHCSPTTTTNATKQDIELRSSTGTGIAPNHEIMEMTKIKIQAKDPGFISEKKFPDISNRGFSFPVLPPLPPSKMLEEPPRESLEVFRPSEEVPRALKKSTELQRIVPDDDVASDASSDLFELESFSAIASTYRRRDSLDEFPKLASATGAGVLQFRRSMEESIAPSECYAPSEVSVEWSVTTAEGGFDRASVANFSSAASDFGEKERFEPAAGNGGGPVKKRGGGGLLSCRCEKAISVGPDPVRFVPDQQQRVAAGPAALPARIARFG